MWACGVQFVFCGAAGGGSRIRTCVALRASDLQSDGFSRSPIPPRRLCACPDERILSPLGPLLGERLSPGGLGARGGSRTHNLPITNRLRCRCATRAGTAFASIKKDGPQARPIPDYRSQTQASQAGAVSFGDARRPVATPLRPRMPTQSRFWHSWFGPTSEPHGQFGILGLLGLARSQAVACFPRPRMQQCQRFQSLRTRTIDAVYSCEASHRRGL